MNAVFDGLRGILRAGYDFVRGREADPDQFWIDHLGRGEWVKLKVVSVESDHALVTVVDCTKKEFVGRDMSVSNDSGFIPGRGDHD